MIIFANYQNKWKDVTFAKGEKMADFTRLVQTLIRDVKVHVKLLNCTTEQLFSTEIVIRQLSIKN